MPQTEVFCPAHDPSSLPSGDYLSPLFSSLKVTASVCTKVQVGNDQEKAQSEKDSHVKNQVGKQIN